MPDRVEEIEDLVDELINAAKDVSTAYEWGSNTAGAERILAKAKEELLEAIRSL